MNNSEVKIGKYKGVKVYVIWIKDDLCGIQFPEEYGKKYKRVVSINDVKL